MVPIAFIQKCTLSPSYWKCYIYHVLNHHACICIYIIFLSNFSKMSFVLNIFKFFHQQQELAFEEDLFLMYTYTEKILFTSMMENKTQMLQAINKILTPHSRFALSAKQMHISANIKFLHFREHASFRPSYSIHWSPHSINHYYIQSLERIRLCATVVDLERTLA